MTDFVNVPREPMRKMTEAGAKACEYELGLAKVKKVYRAMVAAALKVDQEPVAWRYRVKEREGQMSGWRLCYNPEPVGANLEAQPLYTRLAPASDGLLKALEAIANDKNKVVKVADARFIASQAIAKYKGPQS